MKLLQRLRLDKVFYGWWLLLASIFVTGWGFGTYYFGFGVFFTPIMREFQWSRAATALAFSWSQMEGGLLAPFVGLLIDRLGPRKLIIVGATIAGIGYVLLAFVQNLWQFYVAYAVFIALGYSAAMWSAPTAAVANWFIRRRSRALAILSTGMALVGGVAVPIMGWLVANFQWRMGAVAVGAMYIVLGVPLAAAIRHRPEQYGLLPDGEPPLVRESALAREQPLQERKRAEGLSRLLVAVPWLERSLRQVRSRSAFTQGREVDFTWQQALRTRAYWLISLASVLRLMATTALVVHQTPHLIDRGIDPLVAAGALGALAFTSLPGRLLFGWLGDRLEKRYLFMTCLLLQGMGLVIFMNATSVEQLYVYLIVFGLGYGTAPLQLAIIGEYFGRRSFGAINGIVSPFSTLGTMSGPLFAGYVFDVTGSYQGAFSILVVVLLAATVAAFFATSPQPAAREKAASLSPAPRS